MGTAGSPRRKPLAAMLRNGETMSWEPKTPDGLRHWITACNSEDNVTIALNSLPARLEIRATPLVWSPLAEFLEPRGYMPYVILIAGVVCLGIGICEVDQFMITVNSSTILIR